MCSCKQRLMCTCSVLLEATLQCPQKSMLCTSCFLPVMQLSCGQVLLNVPCPQTAALDSMLPRCRAQVLRDGISSNVGKLKTVALEFCNTMRGAL